MDEDAAKVEVRLGGGGNLEFGSREDAVGLKLSIDRRTGGSGGIGLEIAILFRTSTLSRRGGRPGLSSGRSLARCIRNGRPFFTGWVPMVRVSVGEGVSTVVLSL